MKYQDINVLMSGMDPRLIKIVQHLHAENAGLKQEITGIARGLDAIINTMNSIATVAGMHQQIFTGLEQGKSMSDIISELRSEHLSGVESEEIKQ